MVEKELPLVLTANEVAKALKVDVQTVHGLLEQGDLHGVKVGSEWRVRLEDVEHFLDPAEPRGAIAPRTAELPGEGQQKTPVPNLLFLTVLSSLVGSVVWVATFAIGALWTQLGYGDLWSRGALRFIFVSLVLFLVGLVAFRARRAVGSGQLGKMGFFLAFAGLVVPILAIPLYALRPGALDVESWFFLVVLVAVLAGICALHTGMILLGLAVLQAKVLVGLHRAVPLVVGLLQASLLIPPLGLVLTVFLDEYFKSDGLGIPQQETSAALSLSVGGAGQGSPQEESSAALWPFYLVPPHVPLLLYGVCFGLQAYTLWRGSGNSLIRSAEKHMEWLVDRLKQAAIFQILEYVGKLTILLAVIFYITDAPERAMKERNEAWRMVYGASQQEAGSGRKEALEGLAREGVSLEGVTINEATLNGIRLNGATLNDAHFRDADLSEASLQGAKLMRADLQGSSLEKAKLERADLSGANLSAANLHEARLMGGTLDRANLVGAVLKDIELEQASFANANLQQAVLDGADLNQIRSLEGADLQGTNIQNADLSGRTDLTQEQIDYALGNEDTKLPDSLERPSGWSRMPEQFLESIPPGRYSSQLFQPYLSFEIGEGWEDDAIYTDKPEELRLTQKPNNNGKLEESPLLQDRDDAYLSFVKVQEVYDPQDRSSKETLSAPRTVDEMVEWLQTNPYLQTGEPEDVTVGGAHGKRLSVDVSSVPDEYPRRSCDGPCVPIVRRSDSYSFGFLTGKKRQVTVLNVGGDVIIAVVTSPANWFEQFIPKANAVLDTVEWEK